MLEIFLFRHGEIITKNRYIGATDLELSERGIQKLQSQREVLAGHMFDNIFSSPLKRCMQTCSHLNLANEIVLDERIREINFGNWEGKNFKEISTNHSSDLAVWKNSPNTFIFPEGEAIQDFRNSVLSTLLIDKKLAKKIFHEALNVSIPTVILVDAGYQIAPQL